MRRYNAGQNDFETYAEMITSMRKRFIRPAAALGALALLVAADGAIAAEIASPWVEGHSSRARLIGGAGIAGVELVLPEGWKTYWRTPGDAGGVPPAFDWSGSDNLANAQVLYPAPKRFSDRSGDTLGYKGTITFPVRLTAKDPAKPIDLHLLVDYGVCKDICIPAQAKLELSLPPDAAMPETLIEAMTKVPAPPEARRESDPHLKRAVVELTGPNPRLVLETEVPGGAAHVDAFLEAPDGLYVPLPTKTADDGKGNVTFEVELGKDVDLDALKGKQLTATIVSDKGQSEATIPLQ